MCCMIRRGHCLSMARLSEQLGVLMTPSQVRPDFSPHTKLSMEHLKSLTPHVTEGALLPMQYPNAKLSSGFEQEAESHTLYCNQT